MLNVDPSSEEALAIQGGYPSGCVLWLRNVHEKSNKMGLKGLIKALLEKVSEGSGLGVEFIDYEKGLDQVS